MDTITEHANPGVEPIPAGVELVTDTVLHDDLQRLRSENARLAADLERLQTATAQYVAALDWRLARGWTKAPVCELEQLRAALLSQHDLDAVGPRRPGGTYRNHYSGTTYRVDALLVGPRAREVISWSDYALVETDLDGPNRGRQRIHCTAWDTRDVVVAAPAQPRTEAAR